MLFCIGEFFGDGSNNEDFEDYVAKRKSGMRIE
jgi:hypothetical protein